MTRTLIVVNGLPGSGKTTLAGRLGGELDAVVISKDTIKEAVADVVRLDDGVGARLGGAAMEMAWALAAGVDGTAIVESWWFAPRDVEHLRAGLARVGPEQVVEVWCEPGVEIARDRYANRERHAVHRDGERLHSDWEGWAREARPLSLCPVVVVDTSGPVDVAAVVDAIGNASTPLDASAAAVRTTGADYLRIAQGYADRFPDGDTPLRILARLTEELGETASAVAHLERHGAKVAKHGEPALDDLAAEVEDLVQNAFALLRHYGAGSQFDDAVLATLSRLRAEGHVT